MRIPLNEAHDIVKAKLKVPATCMIPVFIGIGYVDPIWKELEQRYPEVDPQLHTLKMGKIASKCLYLCGTTDGGHG